MKAPCLLILSLLVGSCAATSDAASPAPETLRAFEPVDAPSIEPPAADARGRGAAVSLDALSPPAVAGPFGGALSTSAQGSAAAADSPHSFGGGIGVRLRGGDSALDLMAQYKYYVNPELDIGGIADWALSPIDSFVIAPAAWWNVDEQLALFGAPGLEFVSGNSKGLLRLGGSYQVALENLTILPFAWYDLVNDRKNAFTFGVAIGF